MTFILHTLPDTQHGLFAHPEVMKWKFHDRILQKWQMSDDAVIAANGYWGNKQIRKAHKNALEVPGVRKVRPKCCIGQNHIISCRNVITGVLKRKAHITSAAKNMNDSSRMPQGIEVLQCISKNNPIKVCMLHFPYSFPCKSNQKPRIVKILPRIM